MKKRTPRRPINKLLVANRGEIAIRVFRAASELGIRTVGIYTHEDRFSLHRYKADEAYEIGQAGRPVASYLDCDAVLQVAQSAQVDAIHPGYGFLSERADLATGAARAGIQFIGPAPATLQIAGDKTKTLSLARRLKVPTVPGSPRIAGIKEAKTFARRHGFPLVFKASFGGGGRGMRVVESGAELSEAFESASREAAAAFGRPDVYLEKYLRSPKHIEVQLVGDGSGEVVHLFERDCSVQRRHQKVIEVAPAITLSSSQREKLYRYALQLGRALRLRSVATAEFLLSADGDIYFIEINPRIQVEHTVTEEITGIDLVQTQIRLAEGASLGELGLDQRKLLPHGVAVQCRITTEDPSNNFTPDTGKLLAYRSASGFGIRLDAGSAFTGAEILPFYDSLLVKVTGRGRSLDEASRRLRRALQEFRIRGVKSNIAFLLKLLAHPAFLSGKAATDFIAATPELLEVSERRDRANRLLAFLGEVMVNGHRLSKGLKRPQTIIHASLPAAPKSPPPNGWRAVLLEKGVAGFTDAVRRNKALLVCDTTLRDAHQSLLATRLRTYDMLQAAPHIAHECSGLFSLEMWGGATFDVCLRFLHEDPWERLSKLRAAIPNIPFQMLIRGANVVGYTNYPTNVVRLFIERAAANGIDIFRIFDCFNNLDQMRDSIDAVKACGAVAQVAICYTGDLQTEQRLGKSGKYNLKYYLKLAREFERAGADMIAIKDMAGLLRPYSAARLIGALKQEVECPIHLHTHDTAGGQVATYLSAAESGVDVVDCAFSSMSGVTSQPCLEGLVAALEGSTRETDLELEQLSVLGGYWEGVRSYYGPFESDLKAATGDVYLNEIPGGQYSNFRPQAAALGLAHRWSELKQMYAEVDKLLGRIIKVTPSSKVVGDLAIFLLSNNLTTADLKARADSLDLPASVIELFRGDIGIPQGGFPRELQRKVLRGESPRKQAPIANVDINAAAEATRALLGGAPAIEQVLSYLMYPHVFREYAQFIKRFADVSILPTLPFFYGLKEGEEIVVDLEPGKRLFINFVTVSDADLSGERSVIFELNGQSRSISVQDEARVPAGAAIARASGAGQIGAPLAGAVVHVAVKQGDTVAKDSALLTIEAMKMQSIVRAAASGKIAKIHIAAGATVTAGQLLIEVES